MNRKPIALTLSMQNSGHGTFPRHQKMAMALKKHGYDVIWMSPPGHNSTKLKKIDLILNFIPNFFFLGIFIKVFLTCLVNLKKLRNIDVIFTIREYDAISIFYIPFFKNSKKIFFSRGDVLSILKINLTDKNLFQKIKDNIIIFLYPFLQKLVILKTDIVIFQANFLKKIFVKKLGIKETKMKVLTNNCIKKNKKEVKIKKKNTKIVIGFAAPMYWSCKGLGIIEILYRELTKQGKKFELHIAGDGPQAIKLKKRLSKISKDQFKWHGWVNNIDIFFQKIDLLIIPSLYDSSPNLLFEAIEQDKIVLASKINAHNEILGYDELLFSNKDINDLIDRIEKISFSKIYRTKIEKKISKIKKKFSFDWDKEFYKLVKKC